MQWAASFKTSITSAVVTEFNTALGTGALVKFWSGTVPANTTDPDPGVQIASCPMNSTPFAPPSGGTTTANALTDDTATGTGTVQCFRMYDSSAVCIAQGTSGDGGTEDFVWDNATFAGGDTAHVATLQVVISVTP